MLFVQSLQPSLSFHATSLETTQRDPGNDKQTACCINGLDGCVSLRNRMTYVDLVHTS